MISVRGVGLLYLLMIATGAAEEIQNLEAITTAVRAFLEKLPGNHHRSTITVDNLDPRLRLTACTPPLAVSLAPGARPTGRTVALVRCTSPRPWSVYVPAKVTVMVWVVVAARPILKDQPVTAADISVEQRDSSTLPAGYITDPNQILGKVLSRPVGVGNVILPAAAQTPRIIRRGDRVALVIQSGVLMVRSSGVALSDAGLGERITVRNDSSRRVVEGTAQENGVVAVPW